MNNNSKIISLYGEAVLFENNTYTFRNKNYSNTNWSAELATFTILSKEQIELRRLKNIDVLYIKDKFKENVSRMTKTGLILPCALFLLLTCLISWAAIEVYSNGYLFIGEGVESVFIFTVFTGVLFFIFFVVLLIKIIKKDKLYLTFVNSSIRQKYITHKEYLEYMDIFDENINKGYIYFKPLETERLIIRELNINDVDDYYDFASREKVFTFLNSSCINSKDESKNIILRTIDEYQKQFIFKLGIEVKEENKIIGFIGLSKYDLSLYSCQIIYAISDDYWQKGYISEAVSAFVSYLKGIEKKLIIAGHVEDNMASGKVLLKNGFTRDPKRDTQMLIHGDSKKIISYSIDERNH